MSSNVEILEKKLRELLAQIQKPKYAKKLVPTFAIGDGSGTDFAVPINHEPFQVFDAGALQKEGSGDEFQVLDNGTNKTISFNVAPTNLNDVTIYSYVRIR